MHQYGTSGPGGRVTVVSTALGIMMLNKQGALGHCLLLEWLCVTNKHPTYIYQQPALIHPSLAHDQSHDQAP